MMTIDELDRAFDAGFIHSRTNVLAPGSFTWTTLGEAAGLDDHQPYVEQTPSLAPMAIAQGYSNYSLPQMPQTPPYSMSSFGLDDDLEVAPRRRRGLVFGLVVAAAAGACAFVVSTGKLGAVSSTVASTHAESKVASAALAPAAEQKLPEPAAKPAEAPKTADATPAGRITDEMKKKLMEADKDREAKVKAKAEKAAKGLRRRVQGSGNSSPRVEGQKLLEGGDKFDPLNSSI